MIALKQLFSVLSLCVLLVEAVPGAASDYTAGTPDGAGKVVRDPESGDRKVEVTAPRSAEPKQQQIPVYVYPQMGRPGPYPPHSAPDSPPFAKPRRSE